MYWKSASEIEGWLDGFPNLERLEDAFNLHQYAQRAIFPSNYAAAPLWEELITLTEAGQAYMELDSEVKQSYPPGDVHLAVFGQMYYHDLLIDLEKSDLEGIRSLINAELLETRLRWPYRFGRLLYDKFNDSLHHNREVRYLEPDQVATLLEGTPQGVYQVGSLLSGPLGLLTSRETRYLIPFMAAPLWHCSDTGCTTVHHVMMDPPRIAVFEAFNRLRSVAARRLGPVSEWSEALQGLHRKGERPRVRRYYDLPAFLGDAIVGDERTTLLATALKSSNRAWLRQTLGSPPRKKRAAEGSAEQVAGQLSEAEQLQMLLLLRDDELVTLIDDCVYNNDIVIPLSEMRSAQVRFSKLNRWDSFVEVSSFGLRAQRRYPLVTLMLSIWETYESQGLMEELSWKLGKPVEGLSRDVLMEYIQEHGPAEVVRDLVLSSRPVALSIANEVNLAVVPNEAREQLVNRFLWKFGFNPSRYDDKYPRLRTRLTQFKDTLLQTNTIRTEDDREEIRSQGVNLFVSVEVSLKISSHMLFGCSVQTIT